MNQEQIIGVMVRACQAIRRMPDDARPARLKAINHGYLHEAEDLKHHEPEDIRRWNKPSEVSMIAAAEELIKLEGRASHRRALWAWSMAHAGGQRFNKWCRSENIHVETGRRRAKAAIEAIRAVFARNDAFSNQNNNITVLIAEPKIGYVEDNIGNRAWMDDEAVSDCILSGWRGIREARNAERRARYSR